MRLPEIHNAKELEALVCEIGFLPFFAHEIKGFSLEDCCPSSLWFSETEDGPWEWKGPVARGRKCLYGKFFRGRAGYVSLEWFPDFANFRRDGYDFDARFEDELASFKDKGVYDVLAAKGSLLSKELKRLCNYKKGGNTGFDGVITRLQMQTYVTIADFEYERSKTGQTYGWGVARYSTPEELFGYERITSAYQREPAESKARILAHLAKLWPEADGTRLARFLK